jgi:hypothetical protein
MSDLTRLEQAVMEKLLEGDNPVLGDLREQFRQIESVEREFTGAGFRTKFRLAPDVRPLSKGFLTFGDVAASIPELKNGAGFVLFVRDGVLKELEGYTYGDESWPSQASRFELGYIVKGQVKRQRDTEALDKALANGSARDRGWTTSN